MMCLMGRGYFWMKASLFQHCVCAAFAADNHAKKAESSKQMLNQSSVTICRPQG